MDCLTIEENNIVELYLLARLSPQDREQFEDHYLDCPQCLEKLELTRNMRDGLRQVAAEDQAQVSQLALLAWLMKRSRPFWALSAAALVAAMALPWVIMVPELSRVSTERDRLSTELSGALAPRVNPLILSLSAQRSNDTAEPNAQVTLRSQAQWLVLELELPPFQRAEKYRVTLRSESTDRSAEADLLWRSDAVSSQGDGPLSVSVNAQWLVDHWLVEPGPSGPRPVFQDLIVELEAFSPRQEPAPAGRYRLRVHNPSVN